MTTKTQMIPSNNSLFKGEMVRKPQPATYILDAHGEPLYVCPECGNVAGMDDCDVIGAEDGCLFCNKCHTEFEY